MLKHNCSVQLPMVGIDDFGNGREGVFARIRRVYDIYSSEPMIKRMELISVKFVYCNGFLTPSIWNHPLKRQIKKDFLSKT